LRLVQDSDLEALFDQMRDPESVQMAAFTPKDGHDREAFNKHMSKVRTAPEGILRAVTRGGHLVVALRARDRGRHRDHVLDPAARSGAKELPARLSRCFWTWCQFGVCMPALPATTSDGSRYCGRRVSRSSTPRSPHLGEGRRDRRGRLAACL